MYETGVRQSDHNEKKKLTRLLFAMDSVAHIIVILYR